MRRSERGRRGVNRLAVVAEQSVGVENLADELGGRGAAGRGADGVGGDGAGEGQDAGGESAAGLVEANGVEAVDVIFGIVGAGILGGDAGERGDQAGICGDVEGSAGDAGPGAEGIGDGAFDFVELSRSSGRSYGEYCGLEQRREGSAPTAIEWGGKREMK